ncbi:hypothetical protein DMH01_03565 [Amycolatopsis sp. WAC 04182]|uniref:hypothetical protein n=1 Tax=Amycolatopsis sp. WAC 04182 TaxID=2203198 RepID=UPI000F7836B6|nr:hypothetical protein [Amycolatopsis sp. WAC 04182]RSN65464.1 hypothetical protein DMH01_03565 [Amycolatopsis sp. WAC 04182]
MNVTAADLSVELKLLRRGRGVAAPQLRERAGPALQTTFQISQDDNTAEVRRKITEGLLTLSRTLPNDLRLAVLAALAMHEEARLPFYQDRVRWVARALDRDDRTARRRIDEGMDQLAALAMGGVQAPEPAQPGRLWHTEELRVTVALDQRTPEVFEFRRIVADADNTSELDLALTLATHKRDNSAADDLRVDVFYGGVLTAHAMESSERVGLGLRLPRQLSRGDRHEFALRFRTPFRYTHFVCVPRHPVDLFDLHIRFATPAPDQVLRLERVFQDDARDTGVTGVRLTPDASGEVHVEFRHLTPGFAYGVRWSTTNSTGAQTH